MSLEDPYFVVKDEVFRAVTKTRELYLYWREIAHSTGAEAEWTKNELKSALRSIEWDLEDLEDTIAIVEKNPSKFRIDNKEVSSRRHFIESTRNEVLTMKEKINTYCHKDQDFTACQPLLEYPPEAYRESNNNLSSTTTNFGDSVNFAIMAARHSGTKYSKLESSNDSPGHFSRLDSPAHTFVGENVSIQQRMLQGQDEQLDVISDSIGTLKTVSRQIGVELDEQAVMLDDFGNELDMTESKLDTTMKKMAKALHMNSDKRQWTAIIILSILLLIVVILFIIL